MRILSEIGDKNGMGLAIVLAKHFRPDKEAFTTMMAMGFSSSINTLAKAIWHEPRPYFIKKMAP